MNNSIIFILKVFHKFYSTFFHKIKWPEPNIFVVDEASDAIYCLLEKGHPCMVARFGSVELNAIINAMGVKRGSAQSWLKSAIQYIGEQIPQFWWNENTIMQMQTNAGFFPPTHENIMKFAELIIKDMSLVDILGSWQANETYVLPYIYKRSITYKTS